MSVGSSSLWQILLAEDNPGDVSLVRRALREHEISCEVRVIPDGEAVLSFFENLDRHSDLPCPDLLLLDLHLPKRDGSEVMRHLRASERCAGTKVVVLTSSDAPVDHETAEQNAALRYFQKPSSLDQFMDLGKIVKDVLGSGAVRGQKS